MKKLILASLLALSVSVMAAVGEGIGSGYKDEIRVSVETDGNKIISIKVVKMDETKRIAEPAIMKLTQEILAQQKVDVDNVAGATYTSLGFKEAVKDAINNAK